MAHPIFNFPSILHSYEAMETKSARLYKQTFGPRLAWVKLSLALGGNHPITQAGLPIFLR